MKTTDTHLNLKLFITANSKRSLRAIIDLKNFLENNFFGFYNLEIINVLERPELAKQNNVLTTPTVVKYFPLPERRVLGDLSEENLLRFGLDLDKSRIMN